MAMILGVGRISIHIPESHSLKEKRRVVKSLLQRLRSRFDVAAAEVGDQDLWQMAVIGIVSVSNSSQHSDEVLQRAIGFVEQNLQSGYITDVHTELVHIGR